MAMSPGSRRPDKRTTVSGDEPQDTAPLNPMQEPLGSMDRPIPRTSDDNDVNLNSSGTHRAAGNLGRTGTPDRGRGGFTTTFAIIAAILVVAFLVALYMNSDRTNVATTPPATTNDTTGSTTPAEPPATQPNNTAPATGDTGTGSGTGSGAGGGTTAPANP